MKVNNLYIKHTQNYHVNMLNNQMDILNIIVLLNKGNNLIDIIFFMVFW